MTTAGWQDLTGHAANCVNSPAVEASSRCLLRRTRPGTSPNWETWPAHMTLYPRALDVSKVLEGQVYQVTSDMSNESENL